MSLHLRNAREDDYLRIIVIVDDWWGGRPMADMLPRLFFIHFQDTSFVVEDDSGMLAGFVSGFVSQSQPDEAYIHFVGVNPDNRRQGVGEQLYAAFFEAVAARGCTSVHSVTSPKNTTSIAFHRRMGFEIAPGDAVVEGVEVKSNYDGRGHDRVQFVRRV